MMDMTAIMSLAPVLSGLALSGVVCLLAGAGGGAPLAGTRTIIGGGALVGGVMAGAVAAADIERAEAPYQVAALARTSPILAPPPDRINFPYDTVPENEPNNSRRTGQILREGVTLEARIGRGDADWYIHPPSGVRRRMIFALRPARGSRCLLPAMTVSDRLGPRRVEIAFRPGGQITGWLDAPARRPVLIGLSDVIGRHCTYNLTLRED